MFALAQLSDLHLAARPRLAQLINKRGLGFINWQRKRKNVHRPEVLDAITRDLKTHRVDHIAVTGDLVNLSLPDEYARARAVARNARRRLAMSPSCPATTTSMCAAPSRCRPPIGAITCAATTVSTAFRSCGGAATWR